MSADAAMLYESLYRRASKNVEGDLFGTNALLAPDAMDGYGELLNWYASGLRAGGGLALSYDVGDGFIDAPVVHANVLLCLGRGEEVHELAPVTVDLPIAVFEIAHELVVVAL